MDLNQVLDLQTVIFYGKSGSGKSTQSQLLISYLKEKDPKHNVVYIEPGSSFRNFAKSQDNFTSRLVKETMDGGGLLPEFLPVWVWTSYFINNLKGDEHLILDGLARHSDEVPILYRAIKFYKR